MNRGCHASRAARAEQRDTALHPARARALGAHERRRGRPSPSTYVRVSSASSPSDAQLCSAIVVTTLTGIPPGATSYASRVTGTLLEVQSSTAGAPT